MSGPAPIYSLFDEAARTEAAVWSRFSAPRDRIDFCESWLSILCMQIDRVSGGLLLLGPEEDGAYVPAAAWPDAGRDMRYLGSAAERALSERRGVVVAYEGELATKREPRAFVGYPIEVAGTLYGAIVLDMAQGQDVALQRALRLMHWASAWLIDHFRKRTLAEREAQLERSALAMEVVATAIQQQRFGPSVLAVANELARRLGCERVSVGVEKSGSVEVRAISHTATFDAKMDMARLIGDAMDEVLDLEVPLVYPPRNDIEQAASAHTALARHVNDAAICSVPLLVDGHANGVVTFERSDRVFDPATVDMCRTIGGLLGPILRLQQASERGALQRMGESIGHGAQVLFGPRHPGAKLVATVLAGLLIAAATVTSSWRVSAKTVIEGSVQRVAAAPFEGFIAESFVRAGDAVRGGQPLARLDDRDLKLEQMRLLSDREQLLRRERQALANQERATLAILSAQIAQADAALTLVTDKLSRATLSAPFDGVVISGDLSQLIGTPVEQGKTLFTVAPLDAWRVILQVDERDIGALALGQGGELILTGMPHRQIPLVVEQITPVSTTQEGRNFFRVEARLTEASDRVRPGMEGVGKIVVGEQKIIWIWTRSFTEWLQLTVWKWLF